LGFIMNSLGSTVTVAKLGLKPWFESGFEVYKLCRIASVK